MRVAVPLNGWTWRVPAADRLSAAASNLAVSFTAQGSLVNLGSRYIDVCKRCMESDLAGDSLRGLS